MRVRIGSSGPWLTNDGTGTVSQRVISEAINGSLNGQSLTQRDPLIRAAHSKRRDRGNASNVLSFRVMRMFDKFDDAADFAMAHDQIIGRTGPNSPGLETDIEIYLDLTSGPATWILKNGVVLPPARSWVGATLILDYTCEGGELQGTWGENEWSGS